MGCGGAWCPGPWLHSLPPVLFHCWGSEATVMCSASSVSCAPITSNPCAKGLACACPQVGAVVALQHAEHLAQITGALQSEPGQLLLQDPSVQSPAA